MQRDPWISQIHRLRPTHTSVKKSKWSYTTKAIVMKPGSLDISGDLEYCGFYIFALSFLVFEIFNF